MIPTHLYWRGEVPPVLQLLHIIRPPGDLPLGPQLATSLHTHSLLLAAWVVEIPKLGFRTVFGSGMWIVDCDFFVPLDLDSDF